MMTLLIHEWVTGGGLAGQPLPRSWAAEGAAMRGALAREFAALSNVRVILTADERVPPGVGPWETVRVDAGEEPGAFETLASRCDYTLLIAPETDGLLAARARVIERAGGRSFGCAPEAIEIAGDKLRFEARLADRQLPTPPCRLVQPARGLPADHPYPAVLKPRDGAGAVNTFLVESADALPAAARELDWAILQPLAPGVPLSASFLIHPSGSAQLVGVGRQRIAIEGSRIVYEGGELPAPRDWLTTDVVRVVDSIPGLRGWIGVDFVYDRSTGRATVIELNPRPTTSIVGWLRLLPPGRLAPAWLGAGAPADLADWADAAAPVVFDADGTFLPNTGIQSA